MPLGHGIEEWWDAVRDRVEVSGHDPTWHVTAGSFDTAMAYASARFEEPAVLAREDHGRWWPRVTLTVTTHPGLAEQAPPLATIARPVVPEQRRASTGAATAATPKHRGAEEPLTSLEEIFAHQEERRVARRRSTEPEGA